MLLNLSEKLPFWCRFLWILFRRAWNHWTVMFLLLDLTLQFRVSFLLLFSLSLLNDFLLLFQNPKPHLNNVVYLTFPQYFTLVRCLKKMLLSNHPSYLCSWLWICSSHSRTSDKVYRHKNNDASDVFFPISNNRVLNVISNKVK